METLCNGATVLHREDSLVLALFNNQYVTWETDSDGNAHWGMYFGDDFFAASANLLERYEAANEWRHTARDTPHFDI